MTLMCVTLLMLSAAAVSATEPACSTQDAAAFKFSLTSRRNETRHRVITVSLANEVPSGDGGNARGQVSLDVSHAYSECGGLERVLVGTVATAEEPHPHRPDYELFPGLGYYKLHTTGLLWEDARRKCVEEHAHLIVINSDREADVVKEFFSRKPSITGTTNSDYYYVDVHDKYEEGKYLTVTGEALSSINYAHWAPENPMGGVNYNYGCIDKTAKMYDTANALKLAFLCESSF